MFALPTHFPFARRYQRPNDSLTCYTDCSRFTRTPSQFTSPLSLSLTPLYHQLLLHSQGITTAVAIQEGLGSALFAAALCFSVIVMYDAMGVRRHAGEQGAPRGHASRVLVRRHGCTAARR